MPNRILKDSIRTSDDINQLSWFEETLFYRLIVSCDDYGRFDGRDLIIKNTLFPLKADLTLQEIGNGIDKLISLGMVLKYEVDGKPYLILPKWTDHQRIRRTHEKYPPPEESLDDLRQSAAICGNLRQPAAICENLPQSAATCGLNTNTNTNTNQNQNTNTNQTRAGARARVGTISTAQEQAFEEFWSLYPKKRSKGQAMKAWEKLNPSSETIDAIMEKLPVLMRTREWTKDGGQFIPYPATWLNAAGWEDETEINVQERSTNGFYQMLREGEFEDD